MTTPIGLPDDATLITVRPQHTPRVISNSCCTEAKVKFDPQEVELRVGDTVIIGEVRMTVVRITGEEVTLDFIDSDEAGQTAAPSFANEVILRPR
ncbi:MAG: hypothetical protein AB8G99_23050 [Planctomycetaceae bacterium]